jgi:hypothetical protein
LAFPAARQLAEKVLRLWADRHETPESFSTVAALALRELEDGISAFRPEIIADWLASTEHLPPQLDEAGNFGDPPITLAWDTAFVIDAYFWRSPSTSIHDHRFSGAFTVAYGRSIESLYRFHCERSVSDHLRLGHLKLEGAFPVLAGSVREIREGDHLIHSVNHIDKPTLTLCIRTKHAAERVRYQWSYYPPALALAADYQHLRNRKLELLKTLCLLGRDEALAYARKLMGQCDGVLGILAVLSLAMYGEAGLARQLSSELRPPEVAKALRDAVDHYSDMTRFAAASNLTPNTRIALYCLTTQMPLPEARELIHRLTNENPVEVIIQALRELSYAQSERQPLTVEEAEILTQLLQGESPEGISDRLLKSENVYVRTPKFRQAFTTTIRELAARELGLAFSA